MNVPSNNPNPTPSALIDPVTALQDEIDAFSLALFESLRGLRDVSTGSTIGVHGSNNSADGSNRVPTPSNELGSAALGGKQLKVGKAVQTAATNSEDDADVVRKLTGTALAKSIGIRHCLEKIPGISRTKDEQLRYLDQLVSENAEVEDELKRYLKLAKSQKKEVQSLLRENVCDVLGISNDQMSN
mmetsp:Transcript_20527/g.26558  ORF Transcript_20527/g.26558 Transcript_20527/m.26558 type:complete len:186 (-) Transcript_20527:172-729(-)|eukprot:CAMPEP_0116057594 /NCGR_PEP_ID=MMETSP0322-20121206/4703_1 /TAXON_ID=163516 /ORGANISM="Leptocylindrus danicus var. apora, Strain B651" /LENGTH=185 /DNA_ID=CAMNT_0003541633 /DNA_START=166 /DNA_END=723 /DNA_ORIENTATION=-